MAPSTLKVDVYIAPIIPFTNPSPTSTPSTSLWSPISCTLIHTATHALLIDTPITSSHTLSLITWIKTTLPPTCTLTHTFTTHAHPDHYLGLPLLAKHFPGLQSFATESVARGIEEAYRPERFAIWEVFFPGEGVLPDAKERIVPVALDEGNRFEVDGYAMHAFDVPHSDCAHSSFLHVPALELVVAGDIVYGDCHQMLAECDTSEKREGWKKALEMVEGLRPERVVMGHGRVWEGEGREMVRETRRYIDVFEGELKEASSMADLMGRMRGKFPERWNEFVLEVSCAAVWEGRGK